MQEAQSHQREEGGLRGGGGLGKARNQLAVTIDD